LRPLVLSIICDIHIEYFPHPKNEWQERTNQQYLEAVEFFKLCGNLRRLYMRTLPEFFVRDAVSPTLTHLSTRFAKFIFSPTSNGVLQNLESIALGFHDRSLYGIRSDEVTPRLRKAFLRGFHGNLASFFAYALNFCGPTVEDLTLDMNEDKFAGPECECLLEQDDSLQGATNLRRLTLAQVDVLYDVGGVGARLLSSLPALCVLKLKRHRWFSEEAFSYLPPTLRLLILSDYGRWDWMNDEDRPRPNEFVSSVCGAIAAPGVAARIERIESSSELKSKGHDDPRRRSGLVSPSPLLERLVQTCRELKIQFEQMQGMEDDGIEWLQNENPDIRIFLIRGIANPAVQRTGLKNFDSRPGCSDCSTNHQSDQDGSDNSLSKESCHFGGLVPP